MAKATIVGKEKGDIGIQRIEADVRIKIEKRK